jgi:hypothetical protein
MEKDRAILIYKKVFLIACLKVLKDDKDLIDTSKLHDDVVFQKFISIMDEELSELYKLTPDASKLIDFFSKIIIQYRNSPEFSKVKKIIHYTNAARLIDFFYEFINYNRR